MTPGPSRSLSIAKGTRALLATVLLSLVVVRVEAGESECFGRVAEGRLDLGVKLPRRGVNFSAYSELGVTLGRTYVHSTVYRIVVAAYAAMERQTPGKVFVYGEASWERGGRIKPHRTHQNGLSVDFMVPVLDKTGRSVPLPTSALNKFGYDLEFDDKGWSDDLQIDFEAIGEHLFQLDQAARAAGSHLALVILDPRYQPMLFSTQRGPYMRGLPFMQKQAWVRHDDHYHVDFAVKCKALVK